MTFKSFTGGIVMTNSWLLSQGDRHLVVDAPEEAEIWLKSLNIKVEAVFLTHQHFDHIQSAAAIQREHQCPIYAFAPGSPQLTLGSFFGLEIENFTVNHVLEGMAEISLIGEKFRLFHVPGHSPDSLCLYHEGSGLCACGDTILPGSHGRTDFPGGSESLLHEGIRRDLYSLPDAATLLPGHGDFTSLADEKANNDALRHLLPS